jgi:hypothetical protein
MTTPLAAQVFGERPAQLDAQIAALEILIAEAEALKAQIAAQKAKAQRGATKAQLAFRAKLFAKAIAARVRP